MHITNADVTSELHRDDVIRPNNGRESYKSWLLMMSHLGTFGQVRLAGDQPITDKFQLAVLRNQTSSPQVFQTKPTKLTNL